MTTASFADPIAELWREARVWLAGAMRDFFGPADIARTFASKARAAIKRRVLLIEALLMKLLLIEAARRPGRSTHLPARIISRAPPAGPRPNLVHTEDPYDPQTWRVRFRLHIPCDRKPRDTGGPRIRDLGRPLLARDIWREQERTKRIARLHPEPDVEAAHYRALANAAKLARRFEALRRVIADPRDAIERLARKLHALGQAAYAAARRIALAPPPRAKRLGPTFANAIVYSCDASEDLRDTS